MDRNGVSQEISSMMFDSVPEMAISIGDASNITYQRVALDTVIEYLSESEWIEGTVSGRDTVTVGEESITLAVNTTIRLKDQPEIVGSLILDKEYADLEYNAKDLQVLLDTLYMSGIFKSRFFGEIQATGGMQVTLTSSLAVIDGIVVWFETPQNVVLKAGYSTVRKDLIVIRKDQANKNAYVTVLEGVPNVNPQVPELTQIAFGVYEIPIAIVTVQPNAISISSGDIEDVRQLSLNLPELDEKIDNLQAENIGYKGIGITSKAKNVKEALYAVSDTKLLIADGKEHFSGKYYENADGGRKPIYYRKFYDTAGYPTLYYFNKNNVWKVDMWVENYGTWDTSHPDIYSIVIRGDSADYPYNVSISFHTNTKEFNTVCRGGNMKLITYTFEYTKTTDSYEY